MHRTAPAPPHGLPNLARSPKRHMVSFMKRVLCFIALGTLVSSFVTPAATVSAEPRVGSAVRLQRSGAVTASAPTKLHTLREAQQAERRLQLQRGHLRTSGASETERQRAQIDASHVRKEVKRLAAEAAREAAAP